MPVIDGTHSMSMTDALGTAPVGIPTTGVESSATLPSDRYQFTTEAAVFTAHSSKMDSSKTMADLATAITNSKATTNPVPLTPAIMGITVPT